MSLIDKVAYITGGTKGIGRGIAQALLAKGMRVAISGRNAKIAQSVAESLGTFDRVIGICSDVSRLEDEKAAVETILKAWGRLDVVIANAGVGHFAAIDEMTSDQWNETINTNLTGVFHTTKATIPALKISKGYLITIASLAGTNFFPKGAAYNASKFGLVGFTQAVMLDVRHHGVKVSTIMPGSVSTYFNGHTPSEADEWKIQPEDIGLMTVQLLEMDPRVLPSKIEVRPSCPPKKNSK